MKRLRSSIAAGMIAAGLGVVAGPAFGTEDPDVRAVLNAAKARAPDIPGQAEALVRLAWPEDGSSDPLVQAAARKELIDFGNYGLAALRRAITRVDPVYSADVVSTLIDARRNQRSGNPPDFLPALEEAIWFGSTEARRCAMLEVARFPYPPAVLTTIDAIYESPELTKLGLRTLGRMRDARARFFLGRVLDHADLRYKADAARSLASLGEQGQTALWQRVQSETRSVREAAVDALLPLTIPDNLSTLYEYMVAHDGDDAGVLDRVRARAVVLEEQLEQQQLSEAASADPGDEPQP